MSYMYTGLPDARGDRDTTKKTSLSFSAGLVERAQKRSQKERKFREGR